MKNGEVTFGNYTTFGELAKVTCDFGYQLKGHPYLVCQADGKWTSNTTCEKVGKAHSAILQRFQYKKTTIPRYFLYFFSL